jgi:hypothetical protein
MAMAMSGYENGLLPVPARRIGVLPADEMAARFAADYLAAVNVLLHFAEVYEPEVCWFPVLRVSAKNDTVYREGAVLEVHRSRGPFAFERKGGDAAVLLFLVKQIRE